MHTVSLDKAHEYMLLNAPLVDRLRFEFQFRDGDPGRVVGAVRAYQNPDGGFGNGLEPDLRGAGSQPAGVDLALFILDEVHAVDSDLVPAALAYLESITRPEGGLPFVLPTAPGTPRAPWWQPEPDAASRLNPTGAILGVCCTRTASGHVDPEPEANRRPCRSPAGGRGKMGRWRRRAGSRPTISWSGRVPPVWRSSTRWSTTPTSGW